MCIRSDSLLRLLSVRRRGLPSWIDRGGKLVRRFLPPESELSDSCEEEEEESDLSEEEEEAEEESRFPPGFRPRQLCRFLLSGRFCPFAGQCTFAHP